MEYFCLIILVNSRSPHISVVTIGENWSDVQPPLAVLPHAVWPVILLVTVQ